MSVTSESYAKADEPIEMPFSVLISEAQGTYILPGTGSSHGRGHFWEVVIVVHSYTCWQSIFSTSPIFAVFSRVPAR